MGKTLGYWILGWTAAGWLLLLPTSSAGIFDRFKTSDTTPVVKIAQGQLTGLFQNTESDKKFMGFYGIPYGQPPVGDLRFKAPQPASAWEGVRAAKEEGNMCPQPTGMMKPQKSVKSASDALKAMASLPGVAKQAARYLLHMSEDCLALNVYTPVETLPVKKALPVLVYIHGGAFMMGSGDYLMSGPEYLMERDIVLVTINYRLGPFGFLASNSSDAPGNAGLKDQQLALKWVRDNIRNFGGDPNKVTIYGESAGSMSAHLHLMSPQSKGLFQGAIMSSGMALDSWIVKTAAEADDASRQLAERLGAGAETVADVKRRIQFLRDASTKDIVASMRASTTRPFGEGLSWTPSVEVADGAEVPFLDKHPNELLVSGAFNQEVAVMIGFNSKEGSILVYGMDDDYMTKLQANPTMMLSPAIYEKVDANTREALTKKITDMYFKNKSISKENMDSLADVLGDEILCTPIHVSTHWHLKHTKAPVYLYYFTLDAYGIASFLLGTRSLKGAGHGDELGYVFKHHMVSDAGTSEKERVTLGTSRMTTLIGNFVGHGNPTPGKSTVLGVLWTPATLKAPAVLEIGDNLTMHEDSIVKERMQFWVDTNKAVSGDPVYDFK